MLHDHLAAFFAAVNADAALRDSLKSARDADAVVSLALQSGFVIAHDEIPTAWLELSDHDLRTITGGAFIKDPGQIG